MVMFYAFQPYIICHTFIFFLCTIVIEKIVKIAKNITKFLNVQRNPPVSEATFLHFQQILLLFCHTWSGVLLTGGTSSSN